MLGAQLAVLRSPRRAQTACLAAGLILLLATSACGPTAAAVPATAVPVRVSATATPPSTPTAPSVVLRATPEASRAMTHLRALAGTIGTRASTTDGEQRAADYIRTQLETAGYRASLEPFPVQVSLGGAATVTTAADRTIEATPMAGAPEGIAVGPLVAVGLGRAADYTGIAARDAVVLVMRGKTQFAEKVRVAQEAGAVALLVINSDAGPFRGDLGASAVSIPVLGIAGSDDGALRALLGQRVTVTSQLEVVSGTSQNVVGQPSNAPCGAYIGAHYDSVPAGPGANDNASGTALILELARARRIDGLCVVAFGSEEIGLLGSRAFVRAHKVQGARFMLNFDMVAKSTGPTLIGDPDLAARVLALPAAAGMSLRATASFGPGASSDHATFIAAGVPALMFYSGNDNFIHTAQDDVRNVTEADLAKFLTLAVATIDDFFKQ